MLGRLGIVAIFIIALGLGRTACAQVSCDADGCELSEDVSGAIGIALTRYKSEMPKVKKYKIFFNRTAENIEVTILLVRGDEDPVYGGTPGRWSVTYVITSDGKSFVSEIYNR
ncbi:hypothetical protein ACFWZ3_00165 [Frateuria sp. GZRR35]|uniref:hypothetical protein n=1 Tax=Frateuria sp. GZRR35 TaxID=3351536 RepID=UPI003EDB8C1A